MSRIELRIDVRHSTDSKCKTLCRQRRQRQRERELSILLAQFLGKKTTGKDGRLAGIETTQIRHRQGEGRQTSTSRRERHREC